MLLCALPGHISFSPPLKDTITVHIPVVFLSNFTTCVYLTKLYILQICM